MFRLKALYAIFIGLALPALIVMHPRGNMLYISMNIMLAFMAPAGYVYSDLFTYASIIVSWLAAAPALIFILKVGSADTAASLLWFNLLTLAYFSYKKIIRREKTLLQRMLNKNNDEKLGLSQERDGAIRFENGIKNKEAEIVNLYEITRKMSEHLNFEDIFQELSLFLKENFTFRKCDLIVLDRADGKAVIDRKYRVWYQDSGGSVDAESLNSRKIIDLFKDGPRDVWLTRAYDARTFERLGIKADDAETLVVLPLLSEHKMVGILALENLPKADLERFIILAMQFALEIKKVLLYEMVEKLAVTDSLTGLYVRRYFFERLEEELQRSKRYNFEFAAIMVDIDDFKKCNDVYGHMVGDVIIKEIARIIKESVRDIDIVGRYGGEEFAIVLPETGMESAGQVAERLRKKVEESDFKAYDVKLNLTVSVGIAAYPFDASEMNDVIDKADLALYQAKKSGKNVVCAYKR